MITDKRGLTRDEMAEVMKHHGLKHLGGWTSANMVAALNASGIEWGLQDRNTATCLSCNQRFDPKGTKQGSGRDKKHCSAECRKTNGGEKILKTDPRKCNACENIFTPETRKGRSPESCSPECKKAAKKAYYASGHYRESILPIIRDKQKAKSRLKTQERIRECLVCKAQFQRPHTWYCSDKCKIERKTDLRKSYFKTPEVVERLKIRSKLPHNRAKVSAWVRKRLKERRQNDPIYLLKERIRNRTKAAFNGIGFTKGCRTREMLGCSWDQFKDHIESQFLKGMKWSNRHLWHIDHIVPLASGTTEEELIRLSHFSNLRPLWWKENIQKGDSIITCQPELLLKHE